MKLQDEITMYERASVDDGAGGKTPGALTEIAFIWANVKPLSGFTGLQFQQLTGTRGYEVWIRTDADREPLRKYLIKYNGIYGNLNMVVEDVEVGKYYTKMICKSENKL